ncbi:MAG: DUF2085 domain-containing protein [Anaerolineaceae bacterium]|nr:DUF2085 domain-containing protein [Anaerolineaceae bacterium]
MTRNRQTAIRLNLFVLRMTRNWLRIATVIVGLYVTLPFAAPTLMKLGATGPAQVLYTLYSPMCHQFAFRSFFLYGEQPVYPRANTGTDLIPFETVVADLPQFAPTSMHPIGGPVGDLMAFTPGFQFTARDFVGNEQMGYKLTLCERDISIYIAIFIGALLYSIPTVRRHLRPVPIWLYVFVGLLPIGLDGFSQMLGYPPFNLWPPRETLPGFRVATGLIFGFMNAWLGLPYLELSMRDTRRQIEHKLRRAGVAF